MDCSDFDCEEFQKEIAKMGIKFEELTDVSQTFQNLSECAHDLHSNKQEKLMKLKLQNDISDVYLQARKQAIIDTLEQKLQEEKAIKALSDKVESAMKERDMIIAKFAEANRKYDQNISSLTKEFEPEHLRSEIIDTQNAKRLIEKEMEENLKVFNELKNSIKHYNLSIPKVEGLSLIVSSMNKVDLNKKEKESSNITEIISDLQEKLLNP